MYKDKLLIVFKLSVTFGNFFGKVSVECQMVLSTPLNNLSEGQYPLIFHQRILITLWGNSQRIKENIWIYFREGFPTDPTK
jgi:hypothetical protein